VTALLGYQAMAPGNHEFDDGPAVLASFIKGCAVSGGGLQPGRSAEPALAGLIAPYAILDVGGRKVGVAGVANEDTATLSSPGPNVRFTEADAPLRRAVEELSRSGVNIIVVLSHAGFDQDKALAATIPGLDVIVGGHSHLLLANGAPDRRGALSLRISGPGGDTVCVVTVGCWGKYLGRLETRFDAQGRLVEASGEAMPMDAGIADDPAMAAVTASYEARLGPFLAAGAGTLATRSAPDPGGMPGWGMPDRGHGRRRHAGCGRPLRDPGRVFERRLHPGRTGCRRGDPERPSDRVSLRQHLAVCEIMGADLLAALEHGVSQAHDPQASGTGRFPQVAGLRYAFDPSREAGSRILSAEMRGKDGKYAPVDPATTYAVAVSDYLLRGGDGYAVFKDRTKNVRFDGRTMDEIVAGFLGARSPLAVALDGRIERKGPER
jgi:5'-nucleotidase